MLKLVLLHAVILDITILLTVALLVLPIILLPILRVRSSVLLLLLLAIILVVLLRLIILTVLRVLLLGLERLGTGLEGIGGRREIICSGILSADMKILLRLTGEILILSGGIILPRVETRHFRRCTSVRCLLGYCLGDSAMSPRKLQTRIYSRPVEEILVAELLRKV